ncbi:MAG: 50S ribosomal protein L25 [Sarcina sp.]
MMNTFKVLEKGIIKNNRKLRSEGFTPAVVYGTSLEKPQAIKIEDKVLLTMFKEKSMGSIIPLELDNKKINCVIKEIQKNNFGKTIHVDFQAVNANDSIKLHIPVEFIGHESLASHGLIFEAVESNLEFHGHPQDIPEKMEIDVAKMAANEKILIKDLNLPKGVSVSGDPETVLAVVKAPHIVEEVVEEAVVAPVQTTESAE